MQSLASNYRPHDWDSVVEQKSIKLILREQINSNSTKNCYLFTGGAGTGKTTCARIFANEINGGKGTPIEVDAASNNGVENVRDIIENAKFKALDAPYKVYIIDECHMLSTGAWNAMLKLLEEPPAQTILIRCTTDPQKIPATILSRVQRYDFQRISFDGIVNRLRYICEQENLQAETEALEFIAKLADGGCRDSITLLDKCVSYDENITIESVIEALGTVNYDKMFELNAAVLENDAAYAIEIIEEIYRAGIDLKQFMKEFWKFLLDAYKFYLLGDTNLTHIPSTYTKHLKELSDEDYSAMLVTLDEIMTLNSNLRWETAPKTLIESTFLMMCTGGQG